MNIAASACPRLLFVVDHDYGALATVMYLLHAQPLSANATILLPRRAYDLQQASLGLASRPYESLQDILDVVESVSPDVVCMYCAYLFAAQNLLAIDDLRQLIRALRKRGCKVATSDPYLGTFPRIVDTDMLVAPEAIRRQLERRLPQLAFLHGPAARLVRSIVEIKARRDVRRIVDMLSDLPHIYPVPIDAREVGSAKPVCFFNPLYIRDHDESRSDSATVPGRSNASTRPSWLFVLAQFDCDYQEKKYGRERFVEIVAAKIRETLDNGRHPTFIGPATLTEALARHFTPDSGVSFLPACPFDEFHRRLLDAEIVYYWQIFSTSTFLRLWNGLPVFFFDQGHNARVLTPFRDMGLKYYYVAGAPTYLDIEKPLDAVALLEAIPGFRETARAACRRLADLPNPREIVSAIIADG